MKGMLKEVSRNPKLMLIGEASTVNKLSPTVSCHQGKTSDTAINKIVVAPPARANQLNFVKIGFMHVTPLRLD